MATRNGKIAHLPNDIREQLNLRLLEGEPGRELAAWLNALPTVQSIMGAQFNGAAISEVNLTHWRQGGYLQWLTERECFDSARSLAEGDGDLAKIGFSAERLLNVLTVRFGQLLMRWDLPCDESASEATAFTAMARKARILQGISRSVLAIYRIQSQSACQKSELSRSSSASQPTSEGSASPSFANSGSLVPRPQKKEAGPDGANPSTSPAASESAPACATGQSAIRNPQSEIPRILSGPITPASIPLVLPQTPFKPDLDLSEILDAV